MWRGFELLRGARCISNLRGTRSVLNNSVIWTFFFFHSSDFCFWLDFVHLRIMAKRYDFVSGGIYHKKWYGGPDAFQLMMTFDCSIFDPFNCRKTLLKLFIICFSNKNQTKYSNRPDGIDVCIRWFSLFPNRTIQQCVFWNYYVFRGNFIVFMVFLWTETLFYDSMKQCLHRECFFLLYCIWPASMNKHTPNKRNKQVV